jgi:hypothetical protein
MSQDNVYSGKCFCGAVEFSVTGAPAAMGYCHCESCRTWSASPVNAFVLWAPTSLKVTRGEEFIATFNKTPVSFRKWCTRCGGHLFTDHPTFKLVDVYAASIPSFPFKPALHVHYHEKVLPIRDGLPKWKDFPKEMGGSGESLPE